MFESLAATIGDLIHRDADRNQKNKANQAAHRHAATERETQREFAQHGLRWKVEDARRAGISPLFALGASGSSYSPVSQPFTESSGYDSPIKDIAQLGQSVARAAGATQTAEERQMVQLQLANARADLDGRTIDNQIKASELARLQKGPAFPSNNNFIDGQGNSGVKTNPMERSASLKGRPDAEAGAHNTVGWARNSDGSISPVPSKDVKERIEDNIFHEAAHFLRNNVMPNFTGGNPPPGYHWDYRSQAYRKGRNPHFNYSP